MEERTLAGCDAARVVGFVKAKRLQVLRFVLDCRIFDMVISCGEVELGTTHRLCEVLGWIFQDFGKSSQVSD